MQNAVFFTTRLTVRQVKCDFEINNVRHCQSKDGSGYFKGCGEVNAVADSAYYTVNVSILFSFFARVRGIILQQPN